MTLTLTQSLRRLEKRIKGPRDWYQIRHCKTSDDKPYFRVEAHIWDGDRERTYEAEDGSFERAVNIVLFNIASPGTI